MQGDTRYGYRSMFYGWDTFTDNHLAVDLEYKHNS